MERVIRNSESAGVPPKDRISPWISRVLSDLSVIAELEWRISLHQPGIEIIHPVEEKELFTEFAKRSTLFAKFFDVAQSLNLLDVGTPLQRFDYQSGKWRTATSTAKMRAAEKQLDQFWAAVDDHFQQKTGTTLQELLSSVLIPRSPKRTPEWVEPTPPPSASTASADVPLHDAFSTFDLQDRTTAASPTDAVPPIKIKIKTRGPPAPLDAENPPTAALAEPQPPPVQTIQVSKRALKVFSVLFHNPDSDSQPGEIPWTEFLHALSSAGFAVEKQYGSAWLFTPSAKSGLRNIMFHEPHLSTKIPYQVARMIGGRLERVYGWTGETFVMS